MKKKTPKKKVSRSSKKTAGNYVQSIIAVRMPTGEVMSSAALVPESFSGKMGMLDIVSQEERTPYFSMIMESTSNVSYVTDFTPGSRPSTRNTLLVDMARKKWIILKAYTDLKNNSRKKNLQEKSKNTKTKF